MSDIHDEHRQRPPTASASPPIIELVLRDVADERVRADLLARSEIWRKRYGLLLQAHNGRDALQDAYEEAFDLVMYLRQASEEEQGLLERCVRLELYSNALAFVAQLSSYRTGLAHRRAFDWRAMTDRQRLEFVETVCRSCGSLDTSCQCGNDE